MNYVIIGTKPFGAVLLLPALLCLVLGGGDGERWAAAGLHLGAEGDGGGRE